MSAAASTHAGILADAFCAAPFGVDAQMKAYAGACRTCHEACREMSQCRERLLDPCAQPN